MEENLIFRNPAAGCKLPSAKPREMKVLIPEEIQRLLIQAIQWNDLNLKTGALQVG